MGNNIEYLGIKPVIFKKVMSLYLKRTLDLVFSCFLLFVLWPLYLLIALLIKLYSPGSVIFRQKRVGKNGGIFVTYKFRTMKEGAESELYKYMHLNEAKGPVFKMHYDPRLTKLGRFLRDTNLDELPQFINVIKGDMSLIGPRPALPQEVSKYTPRQEERLRVKPGIASLIHAEGRYFIGVDFDKWLDYDLFYIQHQSFFMDLNIISRLIIRTSIHFFKKILFLYP